MKIGKLPEPVLIRSVLKQVGHRRNEVLVGPAVGQDCAVMELEEGEVFVLSCDPITGTTKDIGGHSVHITANDLAASGAEPVGIMLTMLLTPDTEEAQLKEIMQDVEKTCKELNMEVLGGHTEVTDVVKQTLISLTGVGKMKKENLLMDWSGRDFYCGKGKRKLAFGAFCAAFCGDCKKIRPISFRYSGGKNCRRVGRICYARYYRGRCIWRSVGNGKRFRCGS